MHESERCTERTYTPYLERPQATSQAEKKVSYVRIKFIVLILFMMSVGGHLHDIICIERTNWFI